MWCAPGAHHTRRPRAERRRPPFPSICPPSANNKKRLNMMKTMKKKTNLIDGAPLGRPTRGALARSVFVDVNADFVLILPKKKLGGKKHQNAKQKTQNTPCFRRHATVWQARPSPWRRSCCVCGKVLDNICEKTGKRRRGFT